MTFTVSVCRKTYYNKYTCFHFNTKGSALCGPKDELSNYAYLLMSTESLDICILSHRVNTAQRILFRLVFCRHSKKGTGCSVLFQGRYCYATAVKHTRTVHTPINISCVPYFQHLNQPRSLNVTYKCHFNTTFEIKRLTKEFKVIVVNPMIN